MQIIPTYKSAPGIRSPHVTTHTNTHLERGRFLPWPSSGWGWARTRWRWWRDCVFGPRPWGTCPDGDYDRASCWCCPGDGRHEGTCVGGRWRRRARLWLCDRSWDRMGAFYVQYDIFKYSAKYLLAEGATTIDTWPLSDALGQFRLQYQTREKLVSLILITFVHVFVRPSHCPWWDSERDRRADPAFIK